MDGPGGRERELVDWRRARIRIAWISAAWLLVGIVGALSTSLVSGPDGGTWLGVAAVGAVLSAVVTVAASAITGMLRAGDRGERLSAGDVGLLPPRRQDQGATEEVP